MFKVGDKVLLKEDHEYVRGRTNPTHTIGTVIASGTHGGESLYVKWSNGFSNNYYQEDLYPDTKLGRLLAGVEDDETA